jgi:hypothetical protein
MRFTRMNRFKAALIHLSLSALVAAAAFTIIYFLWFPGALFGAAGGLKLFALIVGVDIALGPLLTLVVFVPGKKGLKFDLTVIALLQVAGLAYGVHVLAEARPVYIAFVRDRFELARANHISPEALEKGRAKGYGELPWTGPRIVGVELPTDPDEQFKLMASASAGIDAQGYPQYYVPYEQVRDEVLKYAQPVDRLRKHNPGDPGAVDREVAKTGRKAEELRYVPLPAGILDLTVFVDAKDARVVALSPLRPW